MIPIPNLLGGFATVKSLRSMLPKPEALYIRATIEFRDGSMKTALWTGQSFTHEISEAVMFSFLRSALTTSRQVGKIRNKEFRIQNVEVVTIDELEKGIAS
ncbi:MAG TPA: hypothetical protein VGM92_15500 [Candidatus Kapabacteria bacterium]|jgi:hypothetical protein